MKKKLLFFGAFCTLILIGYLLLFNLDSENKSISEIRKQHQIFLKNSPFKKTLSLSKKERKAFGIPPNKYFERQWELTMNPRTGKPYPEKVLQLQKELNTTNTSNTARLPGESETLIWEEKGPNNVGGRTRAIMYDPNDSNNQRVFAGGVSGGLWVNNNITNVNSQWNLVNIPNNLAISSLTYDPNSTNILYAGTGESYVGGDVNGNGLWQSTDGGTTWNQIFGGVTGETTFESDAKLTVNSPLNISGEYVVTTANFGPDLTSISGNLILATNNSTEPTEACGEITNGSAISGNIAVIERGNCTFVEKVTNAQNNGAIAVLIVNNVVGTPIILGGDDASITIPSVMISKEEGTTIMNELNNGVNVTLEPVDSPFFGNFVTPGIQHINDVRVRNNNGVSEVYVAVAESIYFDSTPSSILGSQEYGIYKSVNQGASWTKLSLPLTANGNEYVPNDIEFAADNTIWLATTSNILDNDGGGAILNSTDGVNFTLKYEITNGDRTQIAVSSSNKDKLYAVAQINTGVANEPVPVLMYKTENSFSTASALALPNDADPGISANDFTRGQSFYDLMLEVDPNNDAILYAGGIDLFRSANSGSSWSQISHWTGNYGYSYVHADQHAFVFHPTNSNSALSGSDGGVFLCASLSTANSNSNAFVELNNNYITTQFYKGAIGQEVSNEKLLAGAQDNGTQLINNAGAGSNSSNRIQGGDGAYVFIDKDNGYMISSYVYNSYYYHNYNTGNEIYTIANDQSYGDFINPAALDSNTNILYTNASDGTTHRIYKYTLRSNFATGGALADDLLTDPVTAFKVSPFNTSATDLLVGTENGKLLKVTNANTDFSINWEDITGDQFFGSISSIDFGANANEIIVTFHNYGVVSIYYSEDGGTTWQNKEGNLPDLPINAVLMNPLNTNEVILGTDLGVWGTPNFKAANPTWSRSQNGMKDVKVTSFDLRTIDNTVLASTYGRGMFTGQFTADDSSLSTEEFTKNTLIKLFPTVSTGEITIAKIGSEFSEGNFEIFDMNGRNVFNEKIKFSGNNNVQLNLNLSSGIYITKFTANNLKSTQKIIIK